MRNSLVSTKAKREAIFHKMSDALTPFGVTAKRSGYDAGHEISATFSAGPYHLDVGLNGRIHFHGFYGHWHTDGVATFPPEFAGCIRGNVNPYHHRKATMCPDDVASLVRFAVAGFACLKQNKLLETTS